MKKKLRILFLLFFVVFLTSFLLNLTKKTVLATALCDNGSLSIESTTFNKENGKVTLTVKNNAGWPIRTFLDGSAGIKGSFCSDDELLFKTDETRNIICTVQSSDTYTFSFYNANDAQYATSVCSNVVNVPVEIETSKTTTDTPGCKSSGGCVENVTTNICSGYKCCPDAYMSGSYSIVYEGSVACGDTVDTKNTNETADFEDSFSGFADLTTKTNNIVTASMGIAGGIAFLLIVIGAFQIILSAGNPDRVKAGKEMITAALSGLFLIIFSVFILKLIGADILQIPGFE